jgi:hypothetical protein
MLSNCVHRLSRKPSHISTLLLRLAISLPNPSAAILQPDNRNSLLRPVPLSDTIVTANHQVLSMLAHRSTFPSASPSVPGSALWRSPLTTALSFLSTQRYSKGIRRLNPPLLCAVDRARRREKPSEEVKRFLRTVGDGNNEDYLCMRARAVLSCVISAELAKTESDLQSPTFVKC